MLRFSIRDVLWLTVVAALALSLWIVQRNFQRERESLKAEREMLKAKRRELDFQFIQLVNSQEELNELIDRQQQQERRRRQAEVEPVPNSHDHSRA